MESVAPAIHGRFVETELAPLLFFNNIKGWELPDRTVDAACFQRLFQRIFYKTCSPIVSEKHGHVMDPVGSATEQIFYLRIARGPC